MQRHISNCYKQLYANELENRKKKSSIPRNYLLSPNYEEIENLNRANPSNEIESVSWVFKLLSPGPESFTGDF